MKSIARGSFAQRGWSVYCLLLSALVATSTWADDDDYPPPFDPGAGFEGIFPNPRLPSNLRIDQATTPHGVRQVFNTPATIMGQSFAPTNRSMDWIGFVFQNHTQPNTQPGPGVLRARVFSQLNPASGELSGLLGESEEVTLPSNSTAWLIFTFPQTLSLTPGVTYYCQLQFVRGYPTWVGGRLHNFYPRGSAFGYLPNPFGGPPQNLNWAGYDLVFAMGTGRSILGAALAEYLQWAQTQAGVQTEELLNTDPEGRINLVNFLRDAAQPDLATPSKSRQHFVSVDGVPHFALTVATLARLDYVPGPEGDLRALSGPTMDMFAPRSAGLGPTTGGLRLIEVIPAVADGLPPLSPFHRYRTFRLSQSVAEAVQGYVHNQVHVETSD
jgi:hypothetical protein